MKPTTIEDMRVPSALSLWSMDDVNTKVFVHKNPYTMYRIISDNELINSPIISLPSYFRFSWWLTNLILYF